MILFIVGALVLWIGVMTGWFLRGSLDVDESEDY